MPANLNALIRYKTIDRLLRNKYIRCDIRRLQEACSEALGEARGRREKVSVRTIRDDIRVMRSDMLEFNAPIVCEEGYYSYSDPTYSIFNVSLNDKAVIRQVIAILLAHRNIIQYPSLSEILETLGNMAGIDIPDMQPQGRKCVASGLPIEEPLYMIVSDEERKHSTESSKKSLSRQEEVLNSFRDKADKREQKYSYTQDLPKCSIDLSQPLDTAVFSWGNVLQML
jgi:hypothetical protein